MTNCCTSCTVAACFPHGPYLLRHPGVSQVRHRDSRCAPRGGVVPTALYYIHQCATGCNLRIHQSLFADDIAAWPSGMRLLPSSQYCELRKYLKHIDAWSKMWGLRFSVKKSGIVLFCHKYNQPRLPSPALKLANKPLPLNPKYKYLGHILHRKLNYQMHSRLSSRRLPSLRATSAESPVGGRLPLLAS